MAGRLRIHKTVRDEAKFSLLVVSNLVLTDTFHEENWKQRKRNDNLHKPMPCSSVGSQAVCCVEVTVVRENS